MTQYRHYASDVRSMPIIIVLYRYETLAWYTTWSADYARRGGRDANRFHYQLLQHQLRLSHPEYRCVDALGGVIERTAHRPV